MTHKERLPQTPINTLDDFAKHVLGGMPKEELLEEVERILKSNIRASSFDSRDTRIWGIDESAKQINQLCEAKIAEGERSLKQRIKESCIASSLVEGMIAEARKPLLKRIEELEAIIEGNSTK